MGGGSATAPSGSLLGREAELAELDRLLSEAAGGAGRGLLIEGPAGIGKSSLVAEACERARRADMNVLSARGGELEHDLAFGIVRQLFEQPLASLQKRSLTRVAAGAAATAVSMLDPSGQATAGGTAPDDASLIHSLYWLCSNLAERSPLLVAVDDLQWADAPSQRFLAYLARRLEAQPILLLLAWRSGEPGVEEATLEALAGEPQVSRSRPDPLDQRSVGELVQRSFGAGAEKEFSRALHRVGGGNPFLTVELIAAAAAEGVAPTAESGERIRELGPEAVARDVLRRTSRLGPATEAVARAVAVLGTDADLGRVAELTRLLPDEASAAADSLAEARVLRPGRPLEFIHPVVRSVVYEEIPAGERSQAHMRAARLLAHAGHVEEAAVHLLSTEGTGDEWVIETLRGAAASAPSPDIAATYLRRALSEPPAATQRVELLLELGGAEVASLDPAAVEHLAEARGASSDPMMRARAGRALADGLFWSGRTEDAERTYSEVIGELGELGAADADPERLQLRLELEAERHFAQMESGRLAPGTFVALRDLVAQLGVSGATPGERVLACLAYRGAFEGASPEEVVEFAEAALEGGDAADALSDPKWYYCAAVWGLEFADRLDAAARHASRALAIAQGRSSPSGIAFAQMALAILGCRLGSLEAARESAEAALDLAAEHGIQWLSPLAGAALADVLIEQDEPKQADRVISTTEIPHGGERDLSSVAFHRHNRARLRLAQGRSDDALADFLDAGRLMRLSRHDHPAYYPWRSGAALVQLALGRRDEAKALVAQELEMARAFGAARPLGVSLRTAGLVEGGEAGLELLREAVEVLEHSPAELERARAIVELGSALRRSGERNAGKEVLLRGLDLADRCASVVLAARARDELHTLGARPRRVAVSGVKSLTAGEERVARLAAAGLSNREIAQRLVVSPRTVENQLGHVYRKLEISSRKQLLEALAPQPP